MNMYPEIVQRAADTIFKADALLIGAGAGMGVDSGLPDFRGDKGFWNAYPPFQGRKFFEISNPRLFLEDPEQAWGFFGHRLNLYRSASPHRGFDVIRKWTETLVKKYFVYTSNVDGHFQRAGFSLDNVVECHGSINHLQCGRRCTNEIWSAKSLEIEVDDVSVRATSPLPVCNGCGDISRPNILMFGDFAWNPRRTARQEDRYEVWLKSVRSSNVVAIEFGAGKTIPTVRYECQRQGNRLIRVNPRDFEAPDDAISIPLKALDAILAIDELLP